MRGLTVLQSRRRKRIFLFLSIPVVVFAALWFVSFYQHFGEPSHQGRNLSEWTGIWFSGYSGISPHATNEEMQDAETAIFVMGTNCIPTLMKWISDPHPGKNQYSTALTVFQILKQQGRPAAPALIELTKSQNKKMRLYALLCLRAIEPEKEVIMPFLDQLLKDPDEDMRYAASDVMGQISRQAEEKEDINPTSSSPHPPR